MMAGGFATCAAGVRHALGIKRDRLPRSRHLRQRRADGDSAGAGMSASVSVATSSWTNSPAAIALVHRSPTRWTL